MITTAGSILHEIAVNVVHSDHIDFLKNFANAYLGADQENEKLIRPTWFLLIKKYRLDLVRDIEEELAQEKTEPELFKKEPVEELVGITTIKEYEQIEEIKGSCPKCGGPLEFKEHVDAFNEDGSPIAEDTYRDPYCPSCKLLWLSQEASA